MAPHIISIEHEHEAGYTVMANIFDRIENRITGVRIEQGIEKLKSTPVEQLSKELEKVNRAELLKKINELDTKKIKDMKIDPEAIKKRLTPSDIEKIKKLAGKDADTVMRKLDELTAKENRP